MSLYDEVAQQEWTSEGVVKVLEMEGTEDCRVTDREQQQVRFDGSFHSGGVVLKVGEGLQPISREFLSLGKS